MSSSRFIPYLQLIRADRPMGIFYFWFPHVYGTLLAGILLQTTFKEFIQANLIVLIGTILLRSATCAWNDIVDAPFDRLVTRTMNRPMARGAISVTPALLYTVVLAVLAVAVLRFIPAVCSIYAIPAFVGWFIYPLSKRITYYPQVILGFPMSWGVFMGAGAMGADPLKIYSSRVSRIASFGGQPLNASATRAVIIFYAANFAWTLCYEIIYSFQDVQDDVKAGVLNIALLLGCRGARIFLTFAATVVVVLLELGGKYISAGPVYYTFCVFGVSTTLGIKIFSVNLSDPKNCAWWFKNGGVLTGTTILSGLLSEYLRKLLAV